MPRAGKLQLTSLFLLSHGYTFTSLYISGLGKLCNAQLVIPYYRFAFPRQPSAKKNYPSKQWWFVLFENPAFKIKKERERERKRETNTTKANQAMKKKIPHLM